MLCFPPQQAEACAAYWRGEDRPIPGCVFGLVEPWAPPVRGGDLNRATALQDGGVMHTPAAREGAPRMIHRSLRPGFATLAAAAGLCVTVAGCGGNPKPKAATARPAPST